MQTFFQKLKSFKPVQWVILAAFVLVLAFTGYYAYRTVEHTLYWREHRDQPIKKWMSVGYISHSYHIPLPELNKAVGLPPETRDKRSLKEIAKTQNRSFEEIKTTIEKAIEVFRSAHPPPSTPGGNR